MIEIKYEDGMFLAKGTFSIGIAGVYENKDFGDGNITIDIELEDLLEDLQEEDSYFYEPLRPYLEDKGEEGAAMTIFCIVFLRILRRAHIRFGRLRRQCFRVRSTAMIWITWHMKSMIHRKVSEAGDLRRLTDSRTMGQSRSQTWRGGFGNSIQCFILMLCTKRSNKTAFI